MLPYSRLFPFLLFVLAPLPCLAEQGSPAHYVNAFGRWIGYGWSRGYHAQDGCGFTSTGYMANSPYIVESQPQPQFMPQTVTTQPVMQHPLIPDRPDFTIPAPNRPSVMKPLEKPQPKPPGKPSEKPMAPSVEKLPAPKPDSTRYQRHMEYPLRMGSYPLHREW